ncbi:hypothetical protein BJ508DRAFT_331166 [Ascobolus immersus RN42]|uniref:Uncharacterized protein n=1 Tax=Ascobolus immersus RN42 TaxID=1160509 RepID=A0A3N4HX19_ASCIM|nr:hypothetical protein BJ508DRAFT_331166 [Ascobolus immersus RN42]
MPQSFIGSTRNVSYDTELGVLSAECRVSESSNEWKTSWLNISGCLRQDYYGIKLFNGPLVSGGDSENLTSFNADHERARVTFTDGRRITRKRESQVRENISFWQSLIRNAGWTDEWTGYEHSVDLNDYLRNKDGLLECVVGEDKEPLWIVKKLIGFINKMPMPGTPVAIVSVKANDLKRKQEYSKRETDDEEWVKSTYVEDKKRVYRGVFVEIKG